ncbi:MAG: hypothetical protein J1F40_00945 [Prevotellaceae bacterium]|nr:hypothetical protein [Prevotellaceae bacterium]
MRKIYLLLSMMLGFCATTFAQNNWMQYLPDDAYVVDVSIPGAHDAATGHGWTGLAGSLTGRSNGTTQDITITEQWNLGVRAFDLRPKVNGNRLAVNHGALQTSLYFDDALKTLGGFLKDNPSEFIVIHMLYAEGFGNDKASFQTMLKTLLESDGVKEYLIDFRNDLTVKDMRGKMLILSRDPYDETPYTGGFFNGWGDGIYWSLSISGKGGSSAPLNVQDLSNVYQKDAGKKAAIIDLLNYSTKHIATTTNDIVWAFNLPSGYNNGNPSSSNGYRANAVNTHPVFIDYLKENPAGPTGVVLMDYVGVDNSKGYALLGNGANYNTRGLELLNDLIANNWRYLPKINAEGKTITVPFYTYKKTGWTCTTGNTFQVNTWSTEGITDGSDMLTPFFENWVSKGGKLGNGEISYTLSECQKGLYKVTIRTRLLNEVGGEVSGASIFANESSIALTNGNACTNGFSSNYSVIGTVGDNGELKFGFKIEDATFNWISFTGVDVEYLGEEEAAFDGGDLILDENAKYNKDLKATYNVAQDAFKSEPSIETYNAMSKAYRDAETSIEAYKALAIAMEDANKLYEEAKEDASEDSKAEYEKIINEAKGSYENGEYLDSEIGRVIHQIYTALAALRGDNGEEMDMTSYIVNPSFETGNMTGWSLPYGGSQDIGVKENEYVNDNNEKTYYTSGCDGDYLFNTWWKGVPITQTIKGLPNGRYRLDAFVASDGATVYLTANGGHNEGTETGGSYPSSDTFQEASYEFDVTNGMAVIGVVGGANGTAGVHKPYQEDGYWWYKADNFRLAYLGSYLSSLAEPFSGSGDVEAGKWYVYDVDVIGKYDFSAIEGIEYTTVDALMSKVKSTSLTDATVRLSAGKLFFKSAEEQSLTISRQTDAVTITETEYAEYVTPFDADFTLTEGITAYKVTEATKVGTKLEEIKAATEGTAVILYGSAADYTINQATSTVAAIKDNLLLPGGDKIADGTTVYVLGSEEGQVGFCLAKEGDDIETGHIYIVVENADAVTFIPFGMPADDEGDEGEGGDNEGNDDEGDGDDNIDTAIDAVDAENGADLIIYNLSGQRVARPTKGIYIVNGQKVLVK